MKEEVREVEDTLKRSHLLNCISTKKEREWGEEVLFEEVMAVNFLKLKNKIRFTQIQGGLQIRSRINKKRSTRKHVVIQMQEVADRLYDLLFPKQVPNFLVSVPSSVPFPTSSVPSVQVLPNIYQALFNNPPVVTSNQIYN